MRRIDDGDAQLTRELDDRKAMLDDGSSEAISNIDKMALCRLVAEHDVFVVVACVEGESEMPVI